jgi:hypothetical protein
VSKPACNVRDAGPKASGIALVRDERERRGAGKNERGLASLERVPGSFAPPERGSLAAQHAAALVPPVQVLAPANSALLPAEREHEREREDEHERDPREHGELVAPGGVGLPLPPPGGGAGQRLQRSSLPELIAAISGKDREAEGGLLVEDDAQTLTGGQMRKGDFMRRLRREVRRVAEEELRRAGRSARDCPYIDRMLGYYEDKSAEQLERSVRRYAPETRAMREASEYVPALAARLARGIARWASTGQMPEDIPDEAMAALIGSRNGIIGAISALAGLRPRRKAMVLDHNPGRVDGGALLRQLGPGVALEGAAQARMERALGHSFAAVRVHDDPRAAELSRELSARAFTLGPHIAFGAGEHRPGTPEGDALLAHELAHVVQQGTAVPHGEVPLGAEHDPLEHEADLAAASALTTLYRGADPRSRARAGRTNLRAPAGLRLQRCSSGARRASELSRIPTAPPATVRSGFEVTGLPEGFSGPRKIYFARGSSIPDGTEIDEISSSVQDESSDSLRNRALDVRGFRSEDEPAALARARATHVAELLEGWGHDAARNVVAEPDAGVGRHDYRELRMVELVDAGGASSVPTSETETCGATKEAAITAGVSRAATMLDSAISALATPTAPTVAPAFQGIFGNPADAALVSRVRTNMTSLKTFLTGHVADPANHECGTLRHRACSTATAAQSAGTTTFCPRFFTSAGDGPVFTLIHEASHGAPWLGARPGHSTEDFAYKWMRAIRFLRSDTAQANADSYVLFIRWLESRSPGEPAGTEPEMGHPNPDEHPSLSVSEGRDAERALAFVEQRVLFAHQAMRNMYGFLSSFSQSPARAMVGDAKTYWDAIAPVMFPDRDPSVAPARQDAFEAAGIIDRLTPFFNALRRETGITMRRVDGPTVWYAGGGSYSAIDIGDDFRAAAADHEAQTQILLTALVRANSGIDPTLRASYLALIDATRVLRGGTAPP